MRLLVVEDDALVRSALRRNLERWPEIEHLVFAGTAKQALHLLDLMGEAAFTAVLSDYDLGLGDTGEELLEAVKKRWPTIQRFGMSGDMERWEPAMDRGLILGRWGKELPQGLRFVLGFTDKPSGGVR